MLTRRSALKLAAVPLVAPMTFRSHATAAPSETLYHATFGAGGMGNSDLTALTANKNVKLVAAADVDLARADKLKERFPDIRIYQDWRKLLDTEKNLTSANISTPDHMHAAITLRCMKQGIHVYTQKPLTQTIAESRLLTTVAAEKKLVTQMGIQVHSSRIHRTVVAIIQSGAIGQVSAVHSWSGKMWGDDKPLPDRKDEIPAKLDWDGWLGVAAERPFIKDVYHPGNWRKRLDFGTGTFGDMGCHILDPVFGSLALTSPKSVRSVGTSPIAESWGLETAVEFVFPATKYTTETLSLTWTNGPRRPPKEIVAKIGQRKLNDQGSIYIGTKGVLYSPYIGEPVLLPEENFKDYVAPKLDDQNHYFQFVNAVRGEGQTSAPFAYSGPLTEMVLLGCLSTRFANETLEWDAAKMVVTNNRKASTFVRREYRKGWEVA